MAVGCKIIRDFPRPARELVERFRGVATSNLVDVMGSCAAIDGALAPIGRGKLLGTAFPVRLPQGDNLMLHAAIDLAQPGDVLLCCFGSSVPNHAAIYCGDGELLHHIPEQLSKRERYTDKWQRRTHSLWRHRAWRASAFTGIYNDLAAASTFV